MTTQTEALNMALEALEICEKDGYIPVRLTRESITAIKEALAQQSNEQVEPVAWRWPYKFKDIGETGAYEYHSHEFACLAHLPKGEPLYTHPTVPTAQPKEPEQEPYGYMKLNTGKFVNEVEGLNPMKDKRYLPLYTTPPQRKPLTDEQIKVIYEYCDAPTGEQFIFEFARAIEAAHGIKE